MTRRRSSFGFFGSFGRSSDLRQLDAALKAVDLHPVMVPEGVKMAIVNLMKDHGVDEDPAAYAPVASLFAYCVLGAEALESANGPQIVEGAGQRADRAIELGEGLDAELMLLAVHSNLIQPGIIERHGIVVDGPDETG